MTDDDELITPDHEMLVAPPEGYLAVDNATGDDQLEITPWLATAILAVRDAGHRHILITRNAEGALVVAPATPATQKGN